MKQNNLHEHKKVYQHKVRRINTENYEKEEYRTRNKSEEMSDNKHPRNDEMMNTGQIKLIINLSCIC